jgi:UTP--glucose-1-phosphate uridylyltransferase
MNNINVEERIRKRMAERGVGQDAIDFFLSAHRQMHLGEQKINWDDITPVAAHQVSELPENGSNRYKHLKALGTSNLGRCAVVKLNGGRSTTMGGQVPKCTVSAKDGMSFLDIVMRQVVANNDISGVEVPLVLMNSFFTDRVTDKIVGKTPIIIMNFVQNEYPRIRQDNFMPLQMGEDEDWCPAGHGDFYNSFYGSGLVDALLDLGLRYVFVSNIDNLSAVLSPVILGMMIAQDKDFIMEVTAKTPADVKGGAPVFYRNQLSLLEIAQVPGKNHEDFQNIERFAYFNTNNLWIDLTSLKKIMEADALHLPIIQNRKEIHGHEIIQIETAMGAALNSFERPGLINVPRYRFAPVKKIADLERLQSDRFELDSQYRIRRKGEEHVY